MINEIPDSALPGRLRVSGKRFCLDDDGPECFIKAVTFGPFPTGYLVGDDVRTELERIKNELGANAVRFYEPPPMTWLNDCAELGLFAFITISWSQHVDFLNQKNIRRETEIRVRDVVERYRGHPAVVGYFIGNEIESILVRYIGPKRVVHFLEDLIEIGRAHDWEVLFSYANYPSTEYLIPENQDFLALNLYLEDPGHFADYLDRLQNLAGNYPVIVSECGVDSKKTGEEKQAEILSWQISEVCRAGIAGMMIFSWCDQWSQDGETLRNWDFGITDRGGEDKPAFKAVAEKWKNIKKASDGLEIEKYPFFSVIICTHRGARQLEHALKSLEKVDYPKFEIVVINDGNDDNVRELTRPLEDVRHVGIPHGGLGAARNLGAKTANGEILVYLDDDCEVEPDWLKWLAHAFRSSEKPDCVGGPNIPPPPTNFEQACIAAAPGGAAHVLIRERCRTSSRLQPSGETSGLRYSGWLQ